MKNFLSWLIFTDKCKYCGELIGKDEILCCDCKNDLPRISGNKCKFCGAGKDRCDCGGHKRYYDGITSPFYYEKGIGKCIKNLKFNNKSYLAEVLAEEMCKAINQDFKDINFDFLCFIPLSKVQKRQRKYNQCQLLAESVSKILKIPLNDILEKLYDTEPQHEMSITARVGNVFGIYDVKDGKDVKGKTILLIDDIKTTGTTLDECAKILKIRGAESVYCVTAALTGKRKSTERNEINVQGT